MTISIIVPVLNELAELPSLLAHLQVFRERGCEVLLVDGGSQDNSAELVSASGYKLVQAERGRARQMNAGARQAHGEILLFLHADTRLPGEADQLLARLLENESSGWGRFDVRIHGNSRLLGVVAFMMNQRSRWSGIATGDQAIFVRRIIFDQVGGFPDQPLMEDIELSARLRRVSRPVCLKAQVTTSGRRWQSRGILQTILLMWKLRLAYSLGVPADKLVKYYL